MSDWLMPSGDVKFNQFEATTDAKDLIVHLPGILSHGTTSFLPADGSTTDPAGVMGALRAYGDVWAASYVGRNFDPRQIARRTAETIRWAPHSHVTVIGSSMGGLLAVDALRRMVGVRQSLRLVLVDTPFAAADLMGGGNIVAPLLNLTRLGQVRRFHDMAIKGVPPKDSEIQDGLDTRLVKEVAVQRMQGFTLGMWMQQLAYMASWRYPSDGPYAPRAHYVACTLGNITVRQPQAESHWVGAQPLLRSHDVKSPHCGYLQQPAEFIRAFRKILGSPLW